MPMDRSRYPANWDEIALAVKAAAGWRCQHCGQVCRKSGETWPDFFDRTCWSLALTEKWGRYTLTVAHLDQDPGNNNPANLKALCSVCHLKHDRPFQARNRAAKRERNGQSNLFNLREKI